MLAKGYDIIFMDYPAYEKNGKKIDGGSDYIQRNAFTLIKLIQTINQTLQQNGSTEQIVMIGPSMGGLISRYALAYMEQNSMLHNTRLWVSFDSPHLGANVPIGDQWMLDYFGNILGVKSAKSSLDGTLNSPAAKEMLLHHYLANTEAPSPHWTRTSFMQELNSLGFPTQLRKVALINGSGNGTLQGSFGDLALHIAARPTNLTRVIVGVGVLLIPFRTLFMKVVKVVAQAAGVTIDVSKTINTHSWFTPGYNGRNQVFSGELFGFILKRKHYASTFSNSIGLDNSMGGYYDTQKIIAKKFEDGFAGTLSWFMKPKIYTIIPTHSFIPAKSSLAVSSISNFGENFGNRNLLATGETPFASYYTPDANEDHVSLTDCSVKWITKEIDGQPQSPIGIQYEISGPSSFCTSQTYSINNLPAGATVTWSVSPSGSVSTSPSGNSVTLTRIADGSITLTAGVTSACGNMSISKPVAVGIQTLSVSSYVDRTPQYNDYQYVTATAVQLPGTVPGDYSWYEEANGIRGAFLAVGLQLSNYPIPPCTTVYYQCVAATTCGEAVYRGYAYNTNCGGYAVSSSLVVYPNPANTELNIHNTDEAGKKDGAPEDGSISNAANPEFQVRLYDEKGNILRSAKNPKGSKGVKLDITDVPNGTYYLHIAKGKEVLKKQIIIQH